MLPTTTQCWLLRQFDVPTGDGAGIGTADNVAEALQALASELERDQIDDEEIDSEDEDDMVDVDAEAAEAEEERNAMSEEELAELNASLGPVRLTLTKVKFKLSLSSVEIYSNCTYSSSVLSPTQSRTPLP